jgi:O-antigen ligase
MRSSADASVYDFGYAWLALLAGASLALSTATQWRAEFGFGPGDLLLGLVGGLALLKLGLRGFVRRSSVAVIWPYLGVVVVVLFVSLLGLTMALYQGYASETWVQQYFFVGFAILYPLILWVTLGYKGFWKTLLWYSVLTVACSGGLLLFTVVSEPDILGLSLYYGAIRFRGWANNPNQMALAVSAIPFLMVLLIRNRLVDWRIGLFVLIGAIVVGLATKSNALLVAWVLGLGLIVVSGSKGRNVGGVWGWLNRRRRVVRSITVFAAVLLMGVGVAWLAQNWVALYEGSIAGGAAGQGSVRVDLWRHGIRAWSASPIVGLGPGHFSGLGGPFGGAEAHNLYVDWLTSYGLVGLAVLAGLFFFGLSAALREREYVLIGLLLVVALISMFHFYARHPIFWMFLLVPYLPLLTRKVQRMG